MQYVLLRKDRDYVVHNQSGTLFAQQQLHHQQQLFKQVPYLHNQTNDQLPWETAGTELTDRLCRVWNRVGCQQLPKDQQRHETFVSEYSFRNSCASKLAFSGIVRVDT